MNISKTCVQIGIEDAVKALDPLHNDHYSITDELTAGKLYADVFHPVLRYNTTSKVWTYYDGIVWKLDEGNAIAENLAQRLARCLNVYISATISDEPTDSEKNYRSFINGLGNRQKRLKMLDDAKPMLSVKETDFDANTDLLNCQNCVLNLRTLEVSEHDPDLLLSKVCNVRYEPEAVSSVWEKFVGEVMIGDSDKIDYLQRVLGYGLLGENTEEKCFMFYGKTTRNGKSTLIETFAYMLGDYATALPPDALAQKNRDASRPNEEIARLKGVRFVHVSEPSKRMIFDVALLKTLTGRDTLTAHYKFGHVFDFMPIYKIYMNTNYLPVVNDDTLFSSERVQVLTFDKHFTREEQDRRLKDTLRKPEVLSGLLNWALEGLRKYRIDGVEPTDAVIDATDEYRRDSDKLGKFIAECLEYKNGRNIQAKTVYDAYSEWCSSNGYGTENKGNFFADLKVKGLFAESGTVNGVTVRNVVKNHILSYDAKTA